MYALWGLICLLVVSRQKVVLRILLCIWFHHGWFLNVSYVGLPGVLWVLPDSYLDVRNKDYGGWFAENLCFYALGILLSLVACLFHHLLTVPIHWYSGDLFIDGKVIHRPQYRFDQNQSTRPRPRPRYDRRRETMQVERRKPIHRRASVPNQQHPARPVSSEGQNFNHETGGPAGSQGNNS